LPGADAPSDRADAAAPRELGTVAVTADTCPDGPGPLEGTRCQVVTVSCPGVPDLQAQVRITASATGVARRGTVVFGTGGGGERWYDATDAARRVLADLSMRGFQVVQRAWTGEWETGPGGLGATSCRYATLLTWIHSDVRGGDGPLCASGNSGGSAEIAYALSRWDREQILDLAVPTGGPVMSRVDLGCLDFTTWPAQCVGLIPAASVCTADQLQCNYAGSNLPLIDGAYTPLTPCSSHDASFAATFLADSHMAPDAVYAFPRTRVHQILGDRDCSLALPFGILWYEALTSDKAQDIVAGTGHATFGTDAGANAIRDAIDTGCVLRH
jgi:hypothetical protein